MSTKTSKFIGKIVHTHTRRDLIISSKNLDTVDIPENSKVKNSGVSLYHVI